MNKVDTLLKREPLLFVFAILATGCLLFWANIRETVINPDAICYLMSAEAIGKLGLSAAMQVCGQAKWPFYSLLIYSLNHWAHLSYINAAYLIDGVFSIATTLLFVSIVHALGGSRRMLWLALAVILFSHELSAVRQYIVRDHGFWAFYLGSLLLLLHYVRNFKWSTALGWSACLLVATLFRIEGAIFLLLLPFAVLFTSGRTLRGRLFVFVQLNVLMVLIGITLLCWLLLHSQQALHQLGRVHEVLNQFQHGFAMIVTRYQTTKAAIIQHVLTPAAARDANLVLVLLMSTWYLLNVIANLSWAYSLLFVYACWHKLLACSRNEKLVLIAYVVVNVVVTATFFAESLFLSKRYLIALSLVLMLWAPFALDKLLQVWPQRRQRGLLTVAVLLMLISAIGGIVRFGYSKAYIRQAGGWLAANVPAKASIYGNDIQLMYYSGHFTNALFATMPSRANFNVISKNQWQQYDYLALRLDKKVGPAVAMSLLQRGLQPIQLFSNKRGDYVAIYKVHS